MTHTILTSDIGGTNARFALFTCDGAELALQSSKTLPTASARSFEEILTRALDDPRMAVRIDDLSAAVFAVAGPVDSAGQRAHLPNVPWAVDLSKTNASARWRLINDFAAQVFACRTAAVQQHATRIQDGEDAGQRATIAAVGAGTGLGCSALICGQDGTYIAVPSEFAHQEFPFIGDEERRFEAFVRRENGNIVPTYDSIVCGNGLSLLHAFFTGQRLGPAEVGGGLTEESQVTWWFARFYGRACRNYALAILPMGGLYICGGVAAKHPLLVNNSSFLQEFLTTHHHGQLLRRMSVFINGNEQSGLWGAARYATQLLATSL